MSGLFALHSLARSGNIPPKTGFTSIVSYGNRDNYNEDGEYTHSVSSGFVEVGAPLHYESASSTNPISLPITKAYEYHPDPNDDREFLFTERLMYHDRNGDLIPFRTKFVSGPLNGLRISHLPNLNLVRKKLGEPNHSYLVDPKLEIAENLITIDDEFMAKTCREWQDDFHCTILSGTFRNSITELNFDAYPITRALQRFTEDAMSLRESSCMSSYAELAEYVAPPLHEIPPTLWSPHEFSMRISRFAARMTPCPIESDQPEFISYSHMGNIRYMPADFSEVADLLDQLDFTDINTDVLIENGNVVSDYQLNYATQRYASVGQYSAPILDPSQYGSGLSRQIIAGIRDGFMRIADREDDEKIHHVLDYSCKVKVIKTINDEALILLFEGHASPEDHPIIGVYLDMAALSLCHLSTMLTSSQ